jgi:glycosyltransferase involved in cell wall biosynthesis
MAKRSVLIIQHTLDPPGGGACVAAWAVQSLVRDYDVSVLCWNAANVQKINRAFDTTLSDDDVHWICISSPITKLVDAIPVPFALLTSSMLFAAARKLIGEHEYDAVFSTMNEVDVGVRAIQYVHYPWSKENRPEVDYRWYHYRWLLRIYRQVCMAVSNFDRRQVATNITLVNSDWTGKVFKEVHRSTARTLYPPVPGGFPDIPFEQRRKGFICVGRISPEKELIKLINILAGVRERGHAITFTIVGHVGGRAYLRQVLNAIKPHKSWITVLYDLPRSELVSAIAQHRYGIHGMVGEHFGIAPAELQHAGCITFVPDDGGVVEIVDHDERVIYHSIYDAIDKIDRVLSDVDVERALLSSVKKRMDLFSEERFVREIREVVASFLANHALPLPISESSQHFVGQL